MSTTKVPPAKKSLADLRAGPTVADLLDAMYRAEGLEPPTQEELANLPPWPKEDADAFERVINEMFERIDDPQHPL